MAEIRRTSEVKVKELTDQQSKHIVALEISDKEVELLKDEVKALQVIFKCKTIC